MPDARQLALQTWARQVLTETGIAEDAAVALEIASDDASFRRYFRAQVGSDSYIFVDAPPTLEDSRPFVHVQQLLADAGLQVPKVFRADLEAGFMMLADFGNTLYLQMLTEADEATIEDYYLGAMGSLKAMQQVPSADQLPAYDGPRLEAEMALFTQWFLPQLLQLEVSAAEQALISDTFASLVASALAQPQVFVHRDFHSRNLMVLAGHEPGIIDFQDALHGPVSYDLVSLLKDCYHPFSRQQVETWVAMFYQQLPAAVTDSMDGAAFLKAFDLMGMQRHLKCAGIFSRLWLRDGKRRYLADIPLVLTYLQEVCSLYPEFAGFGDWLQTRVVPGLAAIEVSE